MGLIGGMARTAVVAGTATAVSNRVSRRQANRWAEKDQAAAYNEMYAQPQYAQPQYAQPQYVQPQPQYVQPQPQYTQQYAAPPPPPAPAAAPDLSAQLQQLAGLRAQGVLSEEEFAAAKAKLLGA
ncbi:MAG TPA: SHOCT domain-containing protein [Acidimicrobiales bacterium]|nr:SHOCT domain-containing protein [Acidimicrobiales bacterium]